VTLANTVLFQIKVLVDPAKLTRSVVGAPTTAHKRTVTFPQEILEIIIADLGDDIWSCYSWYLVAVPRLHHTLTVDRYSMDPGRRELRPLAKLHKMDLLPFVKKLLIRVSPYDPWLSPRKFDRKTLRYFSALTNIQQLRIENLDLLKFMPGVERYFGHFAPTLRCISLTISSGSQRQLLYFLALFPNLDDIEIEYHSTTDSGAAVNRDSEVAVPFSVPSLRGQLKLTRFPSEPVSRDMITLFGGLRFRRLDLLRVEGSRLLLEACADTLRMVRVYPVIPDSAEPILTSMSSY